MTSRRALLFCGHCSPYGLAHLTPILESPLEIVAVVLADERRWSLFREALAGKPDVAKPQSLPAKIWDFPRSLRAQRHRVRHRKRVESLCSRKAVPVWWTHDANDSAFLAKVGEEEPDWVLSAAYPQIFGSALLGIPKLGSINFHPSLLPRFRGAHPHYWAVATGASETGLTAHFMTERIDDGDIVASVAFCIDGLTYQQVYDKIVAETPEFVATVAAMCRSDKPAATPQDPGNATYFRNDRDIHHRVFWDHMSSREIINLVRTGKAYCFLQRDRVGVLDAYPSESNRNLTNDVKVSPGAIVDISEEAVVAKAIDGCVNIRRFSLRQRPCTPDSWSAKLNVKIGEMFS